MRYPIAIKRPVLSNQAWSVVVPDLEGCFSASDSGIDEAVNNAKEAIELWIETAIDQGQDIPLPSLGSELWNDPRFKGWEIAMVEIDSDALIASCRKQSLPLLGDPQELDICNDLGEMGDTKDWS